MKLYIFLGYVRWWDQDGGSCDCLQRLLAGNSIITSLWSHNWPKPWYLNYGEKIALFELHIHSPFVQKWVVWSFEDPSLGLIHQSRQSPRCFGRIYTNHKIRPIKTHTLRHKLHYISNRNRKDSGWMWIEKRKVIRPDS